MRTGREGEGFIRAGSGRRVLGRVFFAARVSSSFSFFGDQLCHFFAFGSNSAYGVEPSGREYVPEALISDFVFEIELEVKDLLY